MPSTSEMPSRGVRTSDVRQQNLAAALRLVHLGGPLSRSALGDSTALTRTAISNLVAELIELELVEEHAPPPSGARGRPSPVVHPRADHNMVVGIDVMVDSVGAVVSGLGGTVLGEARAARTGAGDAGASIAQAMRLASTLVDGLPAPPRTLGIGVAVPGLVAQPSQRVVLAPNLGWSDVDIATHVRDIAGHDAFVTVANEADLGAIAESRRGTLESAGHVLFVSGEVGVGGGIISAGRLLTGTNGFAGEIGHIPINPAGTRCSCGATGCFETELGEAALLDRAGIDGSGRAAVDTLLARADRGDARVETALAEHARWLAFGLSGPLNLLDLDLVVLGGLLGRIFGYIETPLMAALADRPLIAQRTTPVVAASLGEQAAAIGAAEFTWDRIIDNLDERVAS